MGDCVTTVLEEVRAATNDPREQLALLMGALLEGGSLGSGPFPTGDSGTSFGPYQFHFLDQYGNWIPTKMGLTPSQSQDPAQAVQAFLPAYSAAVKRVPDALWNSSPATAAATAAYYAEQPAYMYPLDRVQSAWDTLTGAATSAPVSGGTTLVKYPWEYLRPGGGLADTLGGAGKAVLAPLDAVTSAVDKLTNPSTWWRVLFVLAGAGLIVIGLIILNGKEVLAMAETAGKAAAV